MRIDAEGLPGFSQKGAGRGASAVRKACVLPVPGAGTRKNRTPLVPRSAALSHQQHGSESRPGLLAAHFRYTPSAGRSWAECRGAGVPEGAHRSPPELPAWSQPITAHVKPAGAPGPRTASGQQRLWPACPPWRAAPPVSLAGGEPQARTTASGAGRWVGEGASQWGRPHAWSLLSAPAAPPPPKRAPTTALTLRSKSMTSELEELGKGHLPACRLPRARALVLPLPRLGSSNTVLF